MKKRFVCFITLFLFYIFGAISCNKDDESSLLVGTWGMRYTYEYIDGEWTNEYECYDGELFYRFDDEYFYVGGIVINSSPNGLTYNYDAVNQLIKLQFGGVLKVVKLTDTELEIEADTNPESGYEKKKEVFIRVK